MNVIQYKKKKNNYVRCAYDLFWGFLLNHIIFLRLYFSLPLGSSQIIASNWHNDSFQTHIRINHVKFRKDLTIYIQVTNHFLANVKNLCN